MALILEIEHLSGVCFAARGPESDAPDWPIQPDRAFSALVAAWAARGEDAGERAALEWLEAQMVPIVEAEDAAPRTAPTVFVPPNDPRTRLTKSLEQVLGAHGRQPRRFPAVAALDRSGGLVTRFVWPDVEGRPPVRTLDAVARDAAYVGHSSSLTRCRFLEGAADPARGQPARRRVFAGRLARLVEDYEASRRPSPGEPARAPVLAPQAPASVFGEDWLVLGIDAGAMADPSFMPDLRAAPVLSRLIRDALMAGFNGEPVPSWISGHAEDGTPTTEPHLAVAPLANLGWAHSDGGLHGFALIPPRGRTPLLTDPDFRKALGSATSYDKGERRRWLKLFGFPLGSQTLKLSFGGEPLGLRSLDPSRYTAAATTWATATPLVLERHLKAFAPEARQAEAADLIARACEHIGLPRPALVAKPGRPDQPALLIDKHSAISGAPSAEPSGGAPPWTRWRLPDRMASRPLVHCVLRFPEPVRGPVILGAGRFVGLGLCLPLDAQSELKWEPDR